jgi:hypothetical protein
MEGMVHREAKALKESASDDFHFLLTFVLEIESELVQSLKDEC